MPEARINIHIDTSGLLGDLQRAIQEPMHLVAIGLTHSQPISTESLRIPETVLNFNPASDHNWSPEDASTAYHNWILKNGFRDLLEAAKTYLDQVARVFSLWELQSTMPEDGTISVSQYEGAMFNRPRKFADKNLRSKIASLRDEQGLKIDESLEKDLYSINSARNCLVHRHGKVEKRDANTEDGLKVSWRRCRLLIKDEDGETELHGPTTTLKESLLCLSLRPDSKTFPIGGQIEFTPQNFVEIAWTIFLFAQSTTLNVEEIGRREGLIPPETDTDT